jgi:retinol dehydrogenase-12
MACRDVDKGQTAAGSISGGEGVVDVWELDLASFDSVKTFARRAEGLERVDALVSNAGVALGTFVEAEGFESCITVNVISTFLLVVLMLPKMKSTAERYGGTPCVSVVSSDGHLFVCLLP